VESGEIIGLAAFAAAMAVLVSASISDWKKREVSDIHWAVLGIFGLALFIIYSMNITGFRWEYICLAAGTILILIDMLWEKEINPFLLYFLTALLFIVPIYPNLSEDIFIAWASIPLCYIVYLGMYLSGILRGGADVKCLMAVTIAFPVYPEFFGLPLIDIPEGVISRIFVCSVSILFVAAIFSLSTAAYSAARNAKDGKISRKMFSSYEMGISEAEGAHVWPVEDIVDGKKEKIKVPEEEEMKGIYTRLREAGCEKVRVTPMIPFIVPITAAAAAVILIGNPLFLIF